MIEGVTTDNYTKLELETWQESMMAGIGIPEMYSNNFMCPKYKNATIRNDFMYTEMSQIIVLFKKCVNHS